MLVAENRTKPVDVSKLGVVAKNCVDYDTPGAAEKQLPDDYVKIMTAIKNRPIEDWTAYSSFAKIFKKSDDQAVAPGTPSGNRRDTEMSIESPGKRGDKAGDVQ